MGKIDKHLDDIRTDIKENLPGWTVEDGSDPLSMVGVVQLEESGKVVDEYQVRLQLSPQHPEKYPTVFEIGGRIERIPDHHISGDGSACLFVADESKKYWNKDTKISDFVRGPVRSYFISQSYYEATGEWIFGERRHGLDGVLDFYYEQLGIDNILMLEKMLQLAVKDTIKGHWPCPCDPSVKLRNCHMQKILALRESTERTRMVDLLETFQKARAEARKPSMNK